MGTYADAYADLLWKENTVRSLKNTAKVVQANSHLVTSSVENKGVFGKVLLRLWLRLLQSGSTKRFVGKAVFRWKTEEAYKTTPN
jgi:hypothetical protein